MELRHRTAARIALVYAAFGLAWVLLSDRVVAALFPGAVTAAQNVKGAAFVVLSAGLIYVLTRSQLRSIERSRAELGWANRQSAVLRRILRHNVRNKVSVVRGYAERIARNAEDPGQAAHAATIVENADELVELGDEAKTLGSIADPASPCAELLDAAAVVRSAVDEARERCPEAEFRVDLPATLPVRAHPRLDVAVENLVENAVEHNSTSPRPFAGDAGTPLVRIDGGETDDGENVRIAVADNGPGIPEVERRVVEAGTETAVVHSTGLGLWIVRAVVTRSGGDLRIGDGEEGGLVEVTLPAAEEAVSGRSPPGVEKG